MYSPLRRPSSRKSKKDSSLRGGHQRYGRFARFEHLESRDLLTMVPLTVTLPRFVAGDNPDESAADPFNTEGDYYAEINIGNDHYSSEASSVISGTDFSTPWKTTSMIDDTATSIPVDIFVFDQDGVFNGPRDEIDISPTAGVRHLHLDVNPKDGTWSGDVPMGSASSKGDHHDKYGEVFFTIDVNGSLENGDYDGDGIPNGWETHGIDVNHDGTIDLTLPGADPLHKDLYVEIDSMVGLAPLDSTIKAVALQFKVAPVTNPDNGFGINLHYIIDETDIPVATWDVIDPDTSWPKGFDDIKQQTDKDAHMAVLARRRNVATRTMSTFWRPSISCIATASLPTRKPTSMPTAWRRRTLLPAGPSRRATTSW